MSKIILPNGNVIEFKDKSKRDPFQSWCIEEDAWILADDTEKLINEAKARNVPSKINLGYKEEKK